MLASSKDLFSITLLILFFPIEEKSSNIIFCPDAGRAPTFFHPCPPAGGDEESRQMPCHRHPYGEGIPLGEIYNSLKAGRCLKLLPTT